MFNFLTDYLVDALSPYVKWVSIALFGALIVMIAVTYFTKTAALKKAVKYFAVAIVFYALAVSLLMLALDIYKHFNAAYLDKNYVSKDVIYFVLIPLAATLAVSLCSCVAVYILKLKGANNVKKTIYILSSICAVAFLVSLVLIAVYYSKHIDGDGYYTADGTNFSLVALYVSALILVAALSAAAYFFGKNGSPLSTKEIARAGVCLAMAYALSYVKLFSMPQGGSITLASMLPIIIYAYIYGARKGIFVGLIYGVLQSLQSPYIIHPAQFLLDYPIAFAALGLAGILKDVKTLPEAAKFAIGTIVGGAGRYISHVISGAFAFGAYAEGQNVFIYSLAYNSYVLIDLVLVIAIGILLTYNKNFRNLFKA